MRKWLLRGSASAVAGDRLRSTDENGAVRDLSGYVVADVGPSDSPAKAAAALVAALARADVVFVPGAIYDPVEIAGSNKTLVMGRGVEFKLPDGAVTSDDVTGPAVFHVSGDNVTVEGDFIVNGNKANNSSHSFPTSVRIGTCYVTGNFVKFHGEVYVKDAYWMGFSVEDPDGSVTEKEGLYVRRLRIEAADYHSALIWSVKNWRIDEITAKGGAVGSWLYGKKDQRIRFGTQLANTSICRNGAVGVINSDRYITLTVENGADNITIPSANTAAGGKIQNVSNIHIGVWNAYDASVKNQAYGLALIGVRKCSIGSAIVKDYDCDDSFAGYAFGVFGASDCRIGSVAVSGSKAVAARAWDMIVTTVDGLDIDDVKLVSPTGTLGGFLFDYDAAYAPQRNLVIRSMTSRGHRRFDVVIENRDALRIGSLNSDAVEQYPQNRVH
jgi:hypothetical protein